MCIAGATFTSVARVSLFTKYSWTYRLPSRHSHPAGWLGILGRILEEHGFSNGAPRLRQAPVNLSKHRHDPVTDVFMLSISDAESVLDYLEGKHKL